MGSLVRSFKFRARGYSLSAHQMAKVMQQAHRRIEEATEADADGLIEDGKPSFKQWKKWALRSGLGGGY